jgi:tetratricopeptide (TPR) repeat protein
MRVYILPLVLVLSSCASRDLRKLSSANIDGMARESLSRWDSKRLAQAPEDQRACYEGEFKEAQELYRKSFATREQNPFYWVEVGNCYLLKQELKKAEIYYKLTFVESKSTEAHAQAWNNLGVVMVHQGRVEDALPAFAEAQKLAPSFLVPIFNQSAVYLELKSYEKVIELLSRKEFEAGNDVDVLYALGTSHLFLNAPTKAEHYLKKIPVEYQRRQDISVALGLLKLGSGKYEEASEVLQNRVPASEDGVVIKRMERSIDQGIKK